MAYTKTPGQRVKPSSVKAATKSVSIEIDPLDPIAWTLDASPEEMGLLNVVELEQGDISPLMESPSRSVEVKRTRKRASEDEEDELDSEVGNKQCSLYQQDDIRRAISSDDHQDDQVDSVNGLFVMTDEIPRLSRRRKKKSKGLPRRPLGAYGIFYHQERQRIVESLTEGSLSEDDIQRQVGKLWRSLSTEEIKHYEERAEDERARYRAEMESHNSSIICHRYSLNSPSKNEPPESEDDHSYYAYDYPPPPAGVMVIPASGSGSDAGSAAASAGMKEATPPTSPVPLQSPPRWAQFPSPVHHPVAYASPVPSSTSSHMVPSSPYYYKSPSPQSWPAPPSPYQHHHPAYSPHFSRPAWPVEAFPRPPHAYAIPPGMELALPHPRGGEQKYIVRYKCYRMRSEDVQGFLDSLSYPPHSLRQPYPQPPYPQPPYPQPPYPQPRHSHPPQPRPMHQPSYGHHW